MTIPRDSPQLIKQKVTRTMTQCINTVGCRFTPTRRRDKKRPEVISNGTSRIRYAKKNELMEYALSAYS